MDKKQAINEIELVLQELNEILYELKHVPAKTISNKEHAERLLHCAENFVIRINENTLSKNDTKQLMQETK